MKKKIILGTLIAAATVAFAAGDRLSFIKNGIEKNSVRIENLDRINYSGNENGKGYTTLNIFKSNGNTKTIDLSER